MACASACAVCFDAIHSMKQRLAFGHFTSRKSELELGADQMTGGCDAKTIRGNVNLELRPCHFKSTGLVVEDLNCSWGSA